MPIFLFPSWKFNKKSRLASARRDFFVKDRLSFLKQMCYTVSCNVMRKNKVQVITVGQYPESKNFIILLQRREKAEHFFFLNQSKRKQK